MAFFNLFKRGASNNVAHPSFQPEWTERGIVFKLAFPLPARTVDELRTRVYAVERHEFVLAHYLLQLAQEGAASVNVDCLLLPWSEFFKLREMPEHHSSLASFVVPPERPFQPVLNHQATLSDLSFDLSVESWELDGRSIRAARRIGAVLIADNEEALLPAATWKAVEAIEQFQRRSAEQRTQHFNELGWGKIRSQMDVAGALYKSQYLATTHVLTPDRLRLPQAREDTPFGRVHTVIPTFDRAPDGWLRAFDQFETVQPHYDLVSSDGGRVRIVLSEPVRKVLQVIKRDMPGRRVAGARAEKFLHNPWAFLGDRAMDVLDEDDFLLDRASAGPLTTIFSVGTRVTDGRIDTVGLVVTEHYADGTARTFDCRFEDTALLAEFVTALESALREERELFPWNEFDLTVDAESTSQLETARQALFLWRSQAAARIDFTDVYTLAGYSERIHGIGVAKPMYVPVMQSASSDADDDGGWVPHELTPMVSVTLSGHDGQVFIPLTPEWVRNFEQSVQQAERDGMDEVRDRELPTAIDTVQARQLADAFGSMIAASEKVKAETAGKESKSSRGRESLLVKTNFNEIDYQEARRAVLTPPDDAKAILPASLRPSVSLKLHQRQGIAWFQHLVALSPSDCRGALLADDMGLGKTLQLLAVLGWFYEQNPAGKPSLVVAPKSLLENWSQEIERFFTPAYPAHLVLHGDELREKKQPIDLIDEQLQTRGITDLLKPDWLGNYKVIVTTYEVLTGYEFSFARQEFAFVICDEAQRIKTPGTRVTLAAKKLKADFRISCTGTPVENSLVDLWCLFDFVQPGLLGALENFGRTYRRPIECNTEEHHDSLNRLKLLIAPQTLRRTKEDIADELKKKYFVLQGLTEAVASLSINPPDGERLEVAISGYQLVLYKGGLKKLLDAAAEQDARQRARLSFGALHLMKAVCAEPYCLPGSRFAPDKRGLDAHLENSPKMRWLLEQLRQVKCRSEKAIIFTELREVQAALAYFIHQRFGLKPSVVNGDTQGRQAFIDRFSGIDGFNVIILSTLAAGAGLNVTAANHVFHYTRAWNAAKENQATDRAYRIGQERDVFVYCPTVVADFPTFEVRLDEMLKRKGKLAGTTMNSSSMEAMLNGNVEDVRMSELLGDLPASASTQPRYLTLEDIDRLDGGSFEYFCRLLWEKRGYVASVTAKRGGDGGIDVIALRGKDGELLQCKSSANVEVGWDAVKEVAAGAARYQNTYSGTRFRRVCVTNRRFNTGAHSQAEANRVQLIERDQLEHLLLQYPLTVDELDDELLRGLPLSSAA
ncbi:restriction endonuclease [Paraburkholderia edwinii]|uniref:Restriction endonuclease n=1 Tax=Paraburkholderia edwinii TaxID=2861782 RepID=A0ABX8UJZ3_9BURK|nr:SNF2-related protein [Paraburkholderia edwinii]QYD69026.1 restriction endonuclease [Paraburkholderia edwinii]